MEASPNEHFRSPTRFDGFDYLTLWYVVPDDESSRYAEIWVQSCEDKSVPHWMRLGEYVESQCDEKLATDLVAIIETYKIRRS